MTTKWKMICLEAQAKGSISTLLLLALRYWGDKEHSNSELHKIICAGLQKRSDKGAYTQEEIIAEYRRINPL
jgi:hypothetical protein